MYNKLRQKKVELHCAQRLLTVNKPCSLNPRQGAGAFRFLLPARMPNKWEVVHIYIYICIKNIYIYIYIYTYTHMGVSENWGTPSMPQIEHNPLKKGTQKTVPLFSETPYVLHIFSMLIFNGVKCTGCSQPLHCIYVIGSKTYFWPDNKPGPLNGAYYLNS